MGTINSKLYNETSCITCAIQLPNCSLKKQSYKALCTLKNDSESFEQPIEIIINNS